MKGKRRFSLFLWERVRVRAYGKDATNFFLQRSVCG